ncbi:MAG: hypothetical protein JW874_14325 [Spirochaetales bacterium]|nr:hypothetical protein [Spirochaetales bacterium]
MKRLILQSGKILREAFSRSQNFTDKERGHLLSEFDLKIHELFVNHIQKKHPDEAILSEEGMAGDPNAQTYWVLDPIDGTTCFIFGEPYFAISLARVHDNEVVEAHVYNPVSDEYYFSDSLLGKSFLNDRPISVSGTDTINEALCTFGYSTNMDAINSYYQDWKYIFDCCRKGLAWVSPALSICNVARGRVDMFIDSGCSMHGQAAASLILKNAGGSMYNYNKSEYDFRSKGGIFTNDTLISLFT